MLLATFCRAVRAEVRLQGLELRLVEQLVLEQQDKVMMAGRLPLALINLMRVEAAEGLLRDNPDKQQKAVMAVMALLQQFLEQLPDMRAAEGAGRGCRAISAE